MHLRNAAGRAMSGTGKSSLSQRCIQDSVIRISHVSKSGEGDTLTTRATMLLDRRWWLPAVDTPGIREFGVDCAARIGAFYPWPLGLKCRFTGSHVREEPGCAVMEGLRNRRVFEPQSPRHSERKFLDDCQVTKADLQETRTWRTRTPPYRLGARARSATPKRRYGV